VRLPAADDLFRPTGTSGEAHRQGEKAASAGQRPVRAVPEEGAVETDTAPSRSGKRSSGRVRHDEKMTVYITSDELLELEHARLSLRRSHGLAVDRGRLVREAVAIVLADLEAHGEESALVRRLVGE